jgi:geranylgeranyl diphosphate synthase type I
LGLAFQARDDVLGIWEESAVTGKAAGGDILKRKKSLPIVFALTRAPVADRSAIVDAFRCDTLNEADVARVVAVLDRCGAREYCRGVVRQHGQAALAALERLPPVPAAAHVRDLVHLVMQE